MKHAEALGLVVHKLHMKGRIGCCISRRYEFIICNGELDSSRKCCREGADRAMFVFECRSRNIPARVIQLEWFFLIHKDMGLRVKER